MTDADSLLMGRADLERAFTALGERLARRGIVADLFVVGGAAMALAYDANRVTRDVDAMFVPHGVVVEESRAVAEELGHLAAAPVLAVVGGVAFGVLAFWLASRRRSVK
jgi:hypothetical protein